MAMNKLAGIGTLVLLALGNASRVNAARSGDFDWKAFVEKIPVIRNDENAPTFHLSLRVGQAGGTPLEMQLMKAGPRCAVLALNDSGLPFQYATDGWAMAIDAVDHSRLALQSGVSPDFQLKGTEAGVVFTDRISAGLRSGVLVDLGSIVRVYCEHAKSIRYDDEARELVVDTENAHCVFKVASNVNDQFPVDGLTITKGNSSLEVRNIELNGLSPRDLLQASLQQVRDLGTKLNEDGDVTDVKSVLALGDPNGLEVSKKLLTLFPINQESHRAAVAEKISEQVRLSRRAQESAVGFDSLGICLSNIQHILESEVLVSLAHPAPEMANMRYSRSEAERKISNLLGTEGQRVLLDLLSGIALNAKVPVEIRCHALNLIGDVGLSEERLMRLRGQFTDDLAAMWMTVEIRVSRQPSFDENTLRAKAANAQTILPIRLSCLEALCFLNTAALPEATVPLLKDCVRLAKTSNWVGESRYLESVAATRSGCTILLGVVGEGDSVLSRSLAIRVLSDQWKPGSVEFESLRTSAEKIILDKNIEFDAKQNCVNLVLRQECSDASISALFDEALTTRDERLADLALTLSRASDHAIAFVNSIERVYSSGSITMKIMALSSLHGRNLKVGTDYHGAVEVLRQALQSDQANVRAIGLRTIAELKQAKAVGLNELAPLVKSRVVADSEKVESRIALFALEKISDGSFRIEGAPRDANDWLARGTASDTWWSEHLDEVRAQAKSWISTHGNQ